MVQRLKLLISKVSSIGVEKEHDATLHSFIIYANLLAFANVSFLLIVSLVLVFVNIKANVYLIFFCLFAAFGQLLTFYLNHIGRNLLARVYIYASANFFLLVFSIIFSHKTLVDTYFIVICISPVFMFSIKEIKWMLLTYVTSFISLVIEYTSLENYLPSYHLLKDGSVGHYGVLLGLVMFIVVKVFIYDYIQRLEHTKLKETNAALEKANTELELFSGELELFGDRASKDLKRPMHHISKYAANIHRQLDNAPVKSYMVTQYVSGMSQTLTDMENHVSAYLSYMRIIQPSLLIQHISASKEVNNVIKELKQQYPTLKMMVLYKEVILATDKFLFSTIIKNTLQLLFIRSTNDILETKIDIKETNNEVSIIVDVSDYKIRYENNPGNPGLLVEQNSVNMAIVQKAMQKLNGSTLSMKMAGQDMNCIISFAKR